MTRLQNDLYLDEGGVWSVDGIFFKLNCRWNSLTSKTHYNTIVIKKLKLEIINWDWYFMTDDVSTILVIGLNENNWISYWGI